MKLIWLSSLCLSLFAAPVFADNSRTAFNELMKNPLIRDYFTYLQQDLIPTRFDTKMRNFLRQNPIMGQLFQANVDNEDASLDEFVNYAESQMTRIRKDMESDQSRKLYRMVVELAKSLGFSDEAIKNISIFAADGSKNAFTVSASKNRIIIVFQSELLEKMPMAEVRAIAAHELGHIVLGHSTIRRLNIFAANLLQSVFAPEGKNPQAQAQQLQQLKEKLGQELCSGNCAVHKGMTPLMKLTEDGESELSLQQIEMQAFAALSTKPMLRNELLANYLEMGLAAMREYLASEMSISIVKTLQENLIRSLQDPSHLIVPVNTAVFTAAITDMLNAMSRSQELSSDRISNSVVKNEYLASSFIRLLGFGGFDFKNRKALIKQLSSQAEGIINKNDREGLTKAIGTSHPSSLLRILLISQLPSYPAVVIANPFTKLLALNQYILMEKALAKMAANQIPENAEEAKQQKAFFEGHIAEIEKASEEVFAAIMAQLKMRSVDQKNPQLSNLIHYSLVHREQQLGTIQELKEKLVKLKDNKDAVEALNSRLEMMEKVFLPQSIEFYARIIKALSEQTPGSSELKKVRLAALQVAATSVNLEEVHKTRQALQAIDPSRRWPENPMDGLNAPDFIVPREIQPRERPKAEPQGATPSFMRMLHCERVLRGS